MTGLSKISLDSGDLAVSTLFITTSYPKDYSDWKGIFIRQLLTALSESSQLDLRYWGPPGTLPARVTCACTESESKWLVWLMNKGGIAHLARQKNLRSLTVAAHLLFYLFRVYQRQNSVKLLHLNWLQTSLPLWKGRTPVLITVLGSDYALLKVPGMKMLLRAVIKRRRCILAPNAEWMKTDLERVFGDIAKIVTIPLGIDAEWFRVTRDAFSDDICRWLVVSRLTKKKIGPLFSWSENFFSNNPHHELHLFGPMQEEMAIPALVNYHGSTFPDELRDKWFPQATGLITLSAHDEGRPQVMLEAMAAGLPIIASNIPAHGNFIDDKKTGILVQSQQEYCQAIEWLSLAVNNKKIADAARHWVKKEIGTWSDCACRYIKAYQMLLHENK